jgi:hypothetical protein
MFDQPGMFSTDAAAADAAAATAAAAAAAAAVVSNSRIRGLSILKIGTEIVLIVD